MDGNGIFALIVLLLYFFVLPKTIHFLVWFAETPLDEGDRKRVKQKTDRIVNYYQGRYEDENA